MGQIFVWIERHESTIECDRRWPVSQNGVMTVEVIGGLPVSPVCKPQVIEFLEDVTDVAGLRAEHQGIDQS